MKNVLFFALFIICLNSFANVYNGEIHEFEQPDGTFVKVKLFGTEFYVRAESLDGYSVIRNDDTGWICYANLSSDGSKLEPINVKYEGTQVNGNLRLPKHLKINRDAILKTVQKNKKLTGFDQIESKVSNKTGVNHILGNYKGLSIIVDFSDVPSNLNLSEFDNFLNGNNYTGYGNNGSIKEYFQDVSNGLVVYENEVFGVFRATKTFAEYDAMPYTKGAQEILMDALQWVDAQGFDFSRLSIKEGRIQAINLMYTGNPPTWAEGMWYHAGRFSGFSADGVSSGPYNTSSANSPLRMGTICHENGHMLCGWPDTYQYDRSENGIGGFDLMCNSGSNNPIPPNPHFTIQAGWNDVVDITNFEGTISDVDWDDKVYKYGKTGDNSEFFLLKSVRKTLRGASLPDQGLTIWHIDTDKKQQSSPTKEVYLRHANNDWSRHNGACFDLDINEFNDNTAPNANWHDGSLSHLIVWNVGEAGAVQDYNIGAFLPPKSNFSSIENRTCKDVKVAFRDMSTNKPDSWSWDFGDGGTSAMQNPIHEYLVPGTYTVVLNSANKIGSHIETKTNYLTVNFSDPPTTKGDTICVDNPANLSASGFGVLNWYNKASGGSIINTGMDYKTPALSATTTYYVSDVTVPSNQRMGKIDRTGGGNNKNKPKHYLIFDVFQSIEIVSVEVYAASAGNRTIELRDSSGNVVQTVTRNLVAGKQTVNLNFNVSRGTAYQLGLSGSTTNIAMFRNNAGVTYPYDLSGIASITGSSKGEGHYYFFYNWVVRPPDCISTRSPVVAQVETCTGLDELYNDKLNIYPNPTKGLLNLEFKNGIETAIEIVNVIGEVVYQSANVGDKITIDLSSKKEGVYFLRINGGEKETTHKIVLLE